MAKTILNLNRGIFMINTQKAICKNDQELTIVIFVRHGQTSYNEAGLMTGKHDPELTELGKSQAEKTGKDLCDHQLLQDNFFSIVSSNMTRTNQTAAGIKEELENCFDKNIDIFLHSGLQEIDRGALQGKPISYLKNELKDLPNNLSHPEHGGESTDQFTQRVVEAACELFCSSTKVVIAVAHGYSSARASYEFMKEEIHLGNSEFLVFNPFEIDNLPGICQNIEYVL